MPVSKHKQTTKKITKLIEQGYGQGEGIHYKPFIDAIRVSSRGRVSRIKGWNGRVHHFLTDLETRLFYLYEYAEKKDIREHYPLLDGMETIIPELDEELMKRLVNQKTGEPLILTTTFLVTEKDEQGKERCFARSVKNYRQLENKQVIERYEIMKRFWESKGIDYGIITNKEMQPFLVMAKNIEFIHPYFHLEGYGINEEFQHLLSNRLIAMISEGGDVKLDNIFEDLESEFSVEVGTAVAIYKHLLARKVLKIDLNKEISFKEMCSSIETMTGSREDEHDFYGKHVNSI